MKNFSVHTTNRPAFSGRKAAANHPKPPLRHPYGIKLRLLAIVCFLIAAVFACCEILKLFNLQLAPDSSAHMIGYLLSMVPRALWLWQGLALAQYAASVCILIAIAYRGKSWISRLTLLAVALGMAPLYQDLRDFGFHVTSLFCISLSFLLHNRKRDYPAGLMMAIAMLIAPGTIAALAYFLWRRRHAYVVSTLAAAAVLSLAAWLVYGVILVPYRFESLQTYALSFLTPWQFIGIDGIPLIVCGAMAPALLLLLIAWLPRLRGATRNRFDYLVSALCMVWFFPAQGKADLLYLIVCYLMMVGIMIEKYGEAAASLHFGVLERWAALFAATSYLLPILPISASNAPLMAFYSFLAVMLLTASVCILTWKLSRAHTGRPIRLSDYRLRRHLI